MSGNFFSFGGRPGMEGYQQPQQTDPYAEVYANIDQYVSQFNPQAAQNYWQQTMKPMYEQAWGQIAPQVEAAYAGPGYYSSARANALTQAKADIGRQETGAYGNLMYNEELMRREAQGQRANIMAQIASSQASQRYAEQMFNKQQAAREHQTWQERQWYEQDLKEQQNQEYEERRRSGQ